MAKGHSRAYKPLSVEFCNSILGKKKTKKIEPVEKLDEIIYNSTKEVELKKEYTAGNKEVRGLSITFKINDKEIYYFIDKSKSIKESVVELLHFGYKYNQIKSLVEIDHDAFVKLCPKGFPKMNDFISALEFVPIRHYKYNDIVHYVREIPTYLKEYPSDIDLAVYVGITPTQAKKCRTLYSKIADLEIKKAEEEARTLAKKEKLEKEKQEAEKVSNNTDVVEKTDVSKKEKVESKAKVKSKVKVVEETPKEETKEEPKETSKEEVIEETPTELPKEESIVETSMEVSEEESKVEPIVETPTELVEKEPKQEVVEVPTELTTDEKSEVEETVNISDMEHEIEVLEDYKVQLGFSGIDFDFVQLNKDLVENLKAQSFSEYVENSNKIGIKNLLYAMYYVFNDYSYSRPFYPAEDKILESYYKDIGPRVIDVMEQVIPDYERRDELEYLMRIREKKYKTPHPNSGFKALPEDIDLIKALYPRVKKAPTKYFFWFDSFDLMYLVESNNVGVNQSKKNKDEVSYDALDIKGYVESAAKTKEVIYHNEFWTSDKHNLFKEEFKNTGLAVMNVIPDLTEEECMEHSKQYKIFQSYTDEEVQKIKEVYLAEGIEGIVKAFSYRTETALRYKVDEEHWEEERNALIQEQEIQARVEEYISKHNAELKEKYRKEILAEEEEKLQKKIKEEITPKIKERCLRDIKTLINGSVKESVKGDMASIVRSSTLKDLPEVLPGRMVSCFIRNLEEQYKK